jgi:2-keto-myo-inositol isomerase
MVHREAAHPNFGILFDCYHFWSGPSKFEDMDCIKPGEIIHAHLNDTQDLPRELLDLQSRVIPGDGVAPLAKILRKLREKGYTGPMSVELFLPRFQQADPFDLVGSKNSICLRSCSLQSPLRRCWLADRVRTPPSPPVK